MSVEEIIAFITHRHRIQRQPYQEEGALITRRLRELLAAAPSQGQPPPPSANKEHEPKQC